MGAGSSAQVQLAPDVIGQWTSPFEEGGSGMPACTDEGKGRVKCKPVAYASGALLDGRVLYFNGVEGSENIKTGYVPELGVETRNSRARVLDLRSGTAQWTVPTPEDGGGVNPEIKENGGQFDNPWGVLGVPGRPGDGPAGSSIGEAYPQEPKNGQDDKAANDSDMFCADIASLADGRQIVVGGTDFYNEPAGPERDDNPTGTSLGWVEVAGVKSTRIFDPRTNTFTQGGHMTHPRWYPALVTLADGKVIVASGVVKLIKSTQGGNVRRTETFDPATNAWTVNYVDMHSENSLPLLPRLFLMPNGKVFYGGTGQGWNPLGQDVTEATWAFQQFFDPETKQWEVAGLAPLGNKGTAGEVMLTLEPPYDKATVLSFGGTLGPAPSSFLPHALSTLTTVGADGSVVNKMTGSLNRPRWFSSPILLPSGEVLAVGGADKDELHSPGFEIPIKTPELYDPATGTWTDMNVHTRDRTYHHSALLLADGRVQLGGHTTAGTMYGGQHDAGKPFANNNRDPSFEVWSPPYLFRGARPTITSAQAGVAWGETFSIDTPNAADIESVVLMRTGSPQHTIDSDQRALRLSFEQAGDSLTATAPPNGNVAPPGYYHLFLNQKTDKGPVPSVARIVHVGATSEPGEAIQPFPDSGGAPVGSATELTDTSYTSSSPEMARERVHEASESAGTAASSAGEAQSPQSIESLRTASTRPPVPVLPVTAAVVAGITVVSALRRWRVIRD
jgi:hypothetical protein